MTGKSYNEIAKEMSKKLDVDINKCKQLIATEDTFIANQTSVRTYEENGVKYYKFVARIDQRTSPQCRELNGKIFEVAKAQAGENLPPLHPWCRSVIVPVFEKEEDKNKPSDTNEITVKTADENKNKRNFEPIRGINGNAPKLDKNGENGYNDSVSEFGPPMPKEQLNRIIKRLREKGITVDMSDEIDEHLKKNNSKGATFNGNTIIFSSDVDRVTVFEELIHLGQHKNTDFELGLNDLDLEIEAAEKLIKNAKAYKLSETEIEQTKINLIYYKKRKKINEIQS